MGDDNPDADQKLAALKDADAEAAEFEQAIKDLQHMGGLNETGWCQADLLKDNINGL